MPPPARRRNARQPSQPAHKPVVTGAEPSTLTTPELLAGVVMPARRVNVAQNAAQGRTRVRFRADHRSKNQHLDNGSLLQECSVIGSPRVSGA